VWACVREWGLMCVCNMWAFVCVAVSVCGVGECVGVYVCCGRVCVREWGRMCVCAICGLLCVWP